MKGLGNSEIFGPHHGCLKKKPWTSYTFEEKTEQVFLLKVQQRFSNLRFSENKLCEA